MKHNLCPVNEPQTPFNPETETFTHAWLCKLYFCMWIRRLQGVQPKNGFCKFRSLSGSLYYHDQKKAWLCSFRKGFTSKIPSSEWVTVHIHVHVQHWFIYYGTNMYVCIGNHNMYMYKMHFLEKIELRKELVK